MSSIHLMRGHLCRGLRPQPWHIIKRYKFSARRERLEEDFLPSTPARTRFAPSPTGYLHIGSLRTALYNYLLAKATGGQFLLRIEDTDQTRIVPDAETRLYDDLKWAGLKWDEGPDIGGFHSPYRQSERLKHYTEHAGQLMSQGLAYRCFCTPHDLDQMRTLDMQDGTRPRYNGKCSSISPAESDRRAQNGEPYCVRFKRDDLPEITDLVYGKYNRSCFEEHFIIMKRDGYPTYHFANVVDDHLMDITHVIRGAEWLISTPKHVALYEAFGWTPPKFAHVGLLVDDKGQKLSKRHGDTDIASWRERGILPIALLNYVMLLGWSQGRGEKGHSEVMNMNDMITKFNLKFTKGNIKVNDKHEHFQRAHMERVSRLPTGEDEFALNIYPELDHSIRLCEKDRLASPALAGFVSRLSGRIGPLVPRARLPSNKKNPTPGANPVDVYREYIREFFTVDRKSYKRSMEYVVRGKYMIWEVPESVYEESLENLMKTNIAFFIVTGEKREKMKETALSEKNESQEEKAREEPRKYHEAMKEMDGFPRGIIALMNHLKEALAKTTADKWTTNVLQSTLKPYIETIFSLNRLNKVRPWGYPLLRWVVNAMEPGPSVIPFMKVLGREETMRRVDLAYKAACTVLQRKRDIEKYSVDLDIDLDFGTPLLTQELKREQKPKISIPAPAPAPAPQ
ncbi:hypothetical protein F4775DRAFT_532769 [Biscogniauxia sp. FL1348]|nr:hypothetical protein F4775DRAFT_532769 [Biscogniauxia sp. FL1348]